MISRRNLPFGIALAVVAIISAFAYYEATKLEPGTYAVFDTTEGNFICRLFPKEAPHTVDNFIGLAEGTKKWRDPTSNLIVTKPFYNGLLFHRVIDGFIIQSGCPLPNGDGTAGPGYTFKDEIADNLNFDNPGMLAMARDRPNTNGSQFFITLSQQSRLNHHYSIFGQVVRGMDVVQKIGHCKTFSNDHPRIDEVIKTIKILRVP
jgi:peptidyl-prolyl cis-trans isomerase A (cyclophilin A)